MKVLFICAGNVARSQMAEAFLKKMTNNKIESFSAGTKISGPEQPLGELMPNIKEVLEVMKEEEIDVSKYIRKQLTKQMIEECDKVIVIMEKKEPIPHYLAQSPKLIQWSVPDPKGQNLEFTRNVKNQIKTYVKNFLNNINKNA